MSLVQHVSATEGLDREWEDDTFTDAASLLLTKTISHKISYDLLPRHGQPTREAEINIGADEVSTLRRFFQVLVGCLICVTAAGITFGFAALKPVLIDQKFYRELCTEHELEKDVTICYLQDQKLNLTFIVASVTCNLSALLVGTILDRFGPKICGIISAVLVAIGSVLMALSATLPFDALIVGSFFLALGGTFSFVPSFHLSNAFPKYQGLILALITGAFDASAAVFLCFRLVYEYTNGSFGIKSFFFLYTVTIPPFILLTQIFLMPTQSYQTRTELNIKLEIAEDPTTDLHDSDDEDDQTRLKVRTSRAIRRKESIASIRSVLGTPRQVEKFEEHQESANMASGVWGTLHGFSAFQQIQTPWFILITLLTILQMARFNFFIATLWSQYEYMLQSTRLATQVNSFFDLVLPLGGVATVPFIGLLLDNSSTVATLSLIVLLSTVIGVLGAIPTLSAAYINVLLFCIFRPLYYSAMSDYAAKVFGFATFGTVYGTIICLSGIAIFAQSGLQAIVHNVYFDDPGPMNCWLAGSGLLIGVCLIMYVDMRGRTVQREHAVEDERRSARIGSRRPSRSSIFSTLTQTQTQEITGTGAIGGLHSAQGDVYSSIRGERRPLLVARGLSTVQERNEPISSEDEE